MTTIGKKLFLAVGLPSLIVALAGMGLLWRRADRAVRQATTESALAMADYVANNFSVTDGPEKATDRYKAHRSVTTALRSKRGLFEYARDVRVVGSDGIVRWSMRLHEEGQPLAPEARAEMERVPVSDDTMVRPLGGMECAGCHPAHAMDVGAVMVVMNQPRLQSEVQSVFGSALISLFVLGSLLIAMAALSMHLLIARRLRRLATLMNRAQAGDHLVRSDDLGQDEISQLGSAFNKMLVTLTSLRAEEIEAHRDLLAAQLQLALKTKLEASNEQLRSRLQELSTLYDLARSFTSTLELPELLARISKLVQEHLRVPQFSIMLSTSDGRLEVKTAIPAGEGTEGMQFKWGEGACGMAAETLQAIYLPDLTSDTAIFERREGRSEVGSLLAVPMVHKDELLGVLNFQRPEVAAFSPEEIDLLTAVGDQAALAVKNARLHEEMRSRSMTDALTGAPNRRTLFGQLEMEIARAQRFGTQLSVLMIDIDHFKILNDTAGHRAGDMVLRQIYELMNKMVRKVDTLARYGGEEFMLLLPQVPKAEAGEVAEKLRKAVDENVFPHGKTQPGGRLTISVGIANLPVDASTQERLVDCADAALYASKRNGRNQSTPFAPGMEQHPGREKKGESPTVRSA